MDAAKHDSLLSNLRGEVKRLRREADAWVLNAGSVPSNETRRQIALADAYRVAADRLQALIDKHSTPDNHGSER